MTPLNPSVAVPSIGVELTNKNYSGFDGVEISKVYPGSAAAKGRIFAGNHLLSIDGHECNLATTAAKRLSGKKGATVTVVVGFFDKKLQKDLTKRVTLTLE